MRTVITVTRTNDKGEAKKQRVILPDMEKAGFFGKIELTFERGILVNNEVYPTIKIPITDEI